MLTLLKTLELLTDDIQDQVELIGSFRACFGHDKTHQTKQCSHANVDTMSGMLPSYGGLAD